MIRLLTAVMAAAFAALAAGAGPGESTIELRSAAQVAGGAPVKLSDVAVLSGDDAEALADVVLAPKEREPGAGLTISIDEVRSAIKSHGRINWGRLTLRGSTCSVSEAMSAPVQLAPAALTFAAPAPRPVPVEGTVRAAAIVRMAQVLEVGPDDIKISFSPADDDILNLPTAGRAVEIHAAGASDKPPLAIALYEGNRTVASRTIRTEVQVRRPLLIAVCAKRRGETLLSADVRQESRWIGPTATPVSPDDAIGSAVQSHLSPGDVVMADDVAPALAVAKGEVVSVRCVSGSVVLATRGRATAAGRTGELLQFQSLDGKRSFFARVDGKGRAVVAAGDAVPADSSGAARTAVLPVRGQRIAPPATRALEALR